MLSRKRLQGQGPMIAHYRPDPQRSRLTVQAFAGGLLSVLAHSPTFAVHDFSGEVRLDPVTLTGAWLAMTIRADSLRVADNVSASDRQEIEDRMRREVLETASYPEVRFETG